MTPNEQTELWSAIRQALLMVVDAIERHVLHLPSEQRTAEIRKVYRSKA
jgi:hypothetical protein